MAKYLTRMGGNSSKGRSARRTITLQVHADEIERYRKIFAKLDRNKDGKICYEELGMAMRQLGQNPTKAELEQIIREVDTNNSGFIEFEEFAMMMIRQIKLANEDEEIQQIFRVFDMDGDGKISPAELYQIMLDLGYNVTGEEIDDMIRDADLDGDGVICFEEFKIMYKSLHG